MFAPTPFASADTVVSNQFSLVCPASGRIDSHAEGSELWHSRISGGTKHGQLPLIRSAASCAVFESTIS